MMWLQFLGTLCVSCTTVSDIDQAHFKDAHEVVFHNRFQIVRHILVNNTLQITYISICVAYWVNTVQGSDPSQWHTSVHLPTISVQMVWNKICHLDVESQVLVYGVYHDFMVSRQVFVIEMNKFLIFSNMFSVIVSEI